MDGFKFITRNGVLFARSDRLRAPHAFSTRLGGVSVLSHTRSMNLVYGRGDTDAQVDENRRIFLRETGLVGETVEAQQVHGTDVLCVRDALPPRDVPADGFVTDRGGVILCVKTADCAPLLFEDAEAGIIGACHAGWRGTLGGIAENTVRQMCALGARADRIHCAVGPCIHSCCYEVGDDFYRTVEESRGADFARRYVVRRHGGLFADIVGMNLEILLGGGMDEGNIDVCGRCTCCEPDIFFSHRATAGRRGTMIAMISLGGTNEN